MTRHYQHVKFYIYGKSFYTSQPLGGSQVTAQGAVRIWWDTSVQAYRLSSPFNKELVDAMKQFVPVSDRSYDTQSKIWTFTEKWFSFIEGFITKTLNIKPIVVTKAQAESAQTGQRQGSTTSPAKATGLDEIKLAFMNALPYDAALSAYRKAAMTLHPDRQGGNMEQMTKLNIAWTRLEKELYNK